MSFKTLSENSLHKNALRKSKEAVASLLPSMHAITLCLQQHSEYRSPVNQNANHDLTEVDLHYQSATGRFRNTGHTYSITCSGKPDE